MFAFAIATAIKGRPKIFRWLILGLFVLSLTITVISTFLLLTQEEPLKQVQKKNSLLKYNPDLTSTSAAVLRP